MNRISIEIKIYNIIKVSKHIFLSNEGTEFHYELEPFSIWKGVFLCLITSYTDKFGSRNDTRPILVKPAPHC